MGLLLALIILPLQPDLPFEDVTGADHGKWITVTITLDSSDGESEGNTIYDCRSDDGIHRTVHFKGIVNLNETVPHVVTGRLQVTTTRPR